MKVLTEYGYKLIEELTLSDKLLSNDDRLLEIVNIHKFYVKPNEYNIPLIIVKGSYGAIEDLYLSPGHKVMVNDKFLSSDKLDLIKMTINTNAPICYYHVETKNYLEDNIIVNGVVVETFTNKEELYDLK